MRTLRTASSLTSRNMSAAPPALTLMPFHYLGSLGVSQESGTVSCGVYRLCQPYLLVPSGGCERLLQVAGHYAHKIWKRHLGVEQVRVPDLFPFETVVALVANLAQGLHLALHRDVSFSREHVPPILPRRDRIFQMRVANPPPQLRHRVFGRFVAIDVGMVSVPE